MALVSQDVESGREETRPRIGHNPNDVIDSRYPLGYRAVSEDEGGREEEEVGEVSTSLKASSSGRLLDSIKTQRESSGGGSRADSKSMSTSEPLQKRDSSTSTATTADNEAGEQVHLLTEYENQMDGDEDDDVDEEEEDEEVAALSDSRFPNRRAEDPLSLEGGAGRDLIRGIGYRRRRQSTSNRSSSISTGSFPTSFSRADGNKSIWAVSANVVNSTIGSGILGLAYTLKNCGLVLGVVLLTVTTLLCAASHVILATLGRYTGKRSWEGLSAAALGRFGPILLEVIMILNCCGTDLSYIIICGDTITAICSEYFAWSFLHSRTVIIILVSLFLILPTLIPRSLQSLVRISVLCVFFYPVIIAIVAARAPTYAATNKGDFWSLPKALQSLQDDSQTDPDQSSQRPNIWSGVSVMAFAMVAQQTTFLHYNSLKKRLTTADRIRARGRMRGSWRYGGLVSWEITVGISSFLSWAISLVFSIVPYIAFGPTTRANVLNNFPLDDHWINFARLLTTLTLIATFPMLFFPARASLLHLLRLETEARPAGKLAFMGVTLALWVTLTIFGILTSDLGLVFELVGALTSSALAFVLPALYFIVLFYVRPLRPLLIDPNQPQDTLLLNKEQELQRRASGKRIWQDIVVFGGLLPFGLVIMLVRLIMLFGVEVGGR